MSGQQLGAREALLSKIRAALRVPSPRPGHHSHGAVTQGEEPAQGHLPAPVKPGSDKQEGEAEETFTEGAVEKARPQVLASLTVLNSSPEWKQWLPSVGKSWDDWAGLFARNTEGLKAEFHLLSGPEELPAALQVLARESGWKQVGFHSGSLSSEAAQVLGLPLVEVREDGYDADALAACDAGITECDALVAQMGSVLLSSRSAGGRALSILPPHHVVLARREQLLPDLPTAFALLHERYGDAWPSLVSFVTGPSRTGDIERILVLGAHGPKRLTIFLL
jgi:L-lactate dehydrogenase complex protein LldG